MTKPANYEEYMSHFRPLEVEVRTSFDEALKHFKSIIQKSKILNEYKEKSRYEKPSEKKRRKKMESFERNRLAEIKEKQMASGEWEKRQQQKEQKRQVKIAQRKSEHRNE
jgi:small subunit ribosomal protein S21